MEIIKPKFDNRSINGGRLDNNIKYITINDKLINKTYISVSINTGSYFNPKNYDGLAHFLEHMLFMGSSKYPNENHYFETLNKHGGGSNAYTDHYDTVYFFNVFDNAIEEISDIFCQFFIDPLFSEKSIKKEINAVNNEHLKNINNDNRKLYQFCLDITNKNAPMNNFTTGSLETLSHDDVRDKMIEFYKNYYTTDNMSICIASSLPQKNIDKILKIFNSIPVSKKKDFKLLIEKPINDYFYTENMGKQYYVQSLKKLYNIHYLWEIPLQNDYKNNPFKILSLILKDSSEKSLYFHLHNLGYLNNIIIDKSYEGTYMITLDLTKVGYEHQNYIEILLFDTINNIKKMNIEDIAKYYQKITNINFNYSSKGCIEELCNYLATNHNYNETKYTFINDSKIYNILTTKEYIKYFNYINTTSSNFIKIIHTDNYPNVKNSDFKITKYYNTKYLILNNSQNNLKENIPKQIFNQIDINNPFSDINTIINEKYNQNIPIKIKKNIWYGSSNLEPFIYINLKMNNYIFYQSARQYNITMISLHLINTIIGTVLNNILQLPFSIGFTTNNRLSSILLNIYSINSIKHIKLLLSKIYAIDYNKFIDMYLLEYYKNLLITIKSDYNNNIYSNSWEYSEYIFDTSLSNESYKMKDLINNLNIDINEIKKFIQSLLKFENRSILNIYGNLSQDDAISISKDFKINNLRAYFPNINKLNKQILVKHPNKLEKSNSVMFIYNIANKFNPVLCILISLYCLILNEPFFNELRTKKQLGYLVSLGNRIINFNYYIIQKIQSDKSVDIINTEIENFNKTTLDYINNIELSTYIETIKNSYNEPDDNLNSLFNKYNTEIMHEKYLFNRKEILLHTLKKIKKIHLIKFVKLLKNPTKIIVKGQ